jgi:diguanylate cyclase (GGDEF)-like protein
MKQIYYDELTGCYNRRFLHYWIETEIKRANRFATKFACILIDIDDFRNINNNFGHLEGDKVLVEFCRTILRDIREVDNLTRYGGDEFIILMPNTDERGAVELAQRIMDNLNSADIAGHKVTCCVGFSIFPDNGQTSESLIYHADQLLYQAKNQGKNRIGWQEERVRKLKIPTMTTIGRDDEISWCKRALREYNTVFIAGEAGIGKTRLVIEIKDRFESSLLLRGNAYAALSSVPYHPYKNMLHELTTNNFSLVQHLFKEIPETFQSEIVKLLPAQVFLKYAQRESLDKYRLYSAFSDFMNRMADFYSPNMVLMLIDDVHWLDRPSCELLDFLIRSVKQNVKIFGTYRVEEIKNSQITEFLSIWAREKHCTQLQVPPLNDVQSRQMLTEIIGAAPTAASKYIFRQSGGNPFYIEEIIRELEHEKKLFWNGKEWGFAKNLDVAIPISIAETIKRKIAFLDPEIRRYLEIAAVYGQEFVAEIIAAATRRNVGQILHAFDELQRLGFIKERTPYTFFFTEDIVRQIVYQNISRQHLLEYHNAVGIAIEGYFHNNLDHFYEQLALHFIEANDANKGLFYSKKAALKAKDNYAQSTAIKFFENALKYEDNIDEIFKMKFSLAEVYMLAGQYDKAFQQLNVCLKLNPHAHKVYEQLGSLCESTGDYKMSFKYYQKGLKMTQGTDAVFTFRTEIAWLYTRLGKYLRAGKECLDLLKKKQQMSKQVLGDVYVILGVVQCRIGKFKQAETWLKKALKIRVTIGDKTRIGACYLDLGLNYYQKFNFKMSEKFYNKALHMFEEIGHQQNILYTLNNLGALYANYDLSKAEKFYLEALKKAKLIGAKRTIVYLHNNLGSIEFNRLMIDQALKNYRQALKYSRIMNFHEGIVFSSIDLSEIHRETARLKKGRTYLEKAKKVSRKIDMKYFDIDCLQEEIEYMLCEKKHKRADALSKKVLAQTRHDRSKEYKIGSFLYRGRVLTAMKQYAQAHTYYRKAYAMVKSLPPNLILGEILYRRGITFKKEGKLKESLKMFIEANRVFETTGNLRFIDKIEHEIATSHM